MTAKHAKETIVRQSRTGSRLEGWRYRETAILSLFPLLLRTAELLSGIPATVRKPVSRNQMREDHDRSPSCPLPGRRRTCRTAIFVEARGVKPLSVAPRCRGECHTYAEPDPHTRLGVYLHRRQQTFGCGPLGPVQRRSCATATKRFWVPELFFAA